MLLDRLSDCDGLINQAEQRYDCGKRDCREYCYAGQLEGTTEIGAGAHNFGEFERVGLFIQD